MPEVVLDTSPLQYLHQVGRLGILQALYEHVIVPEAVVAELEEGIARGVSLPDVALNPWISIQQPRQRDLLPLVADLGPGEREVLALAKERSGSLAVLDDALARRYAHTLGLSYTGTLGVLLKAKRAGHLTKIVPVLEQLAALRFRLDPATHAAVLKLAGE